MNVRIARDGVEIGECDWEDLEELVNEGQVRLTDHYWYEGMPDWRLLADLIGLAEPEPAAPQPPSDWETGEFSAPPPRPVEWDSGESIALPAVRSRPSIKTIAIGSAVAAAVVVALYLVIAFRVNRPDTALPIAVPTPDVETTYTALRTRAIAELNEKFKALPSVPAPPANTFYYGFLVKMPPAPGLLTATISGTEDVVEPGTHKTIWHTTFALKADYSKGRWSFKSYRASKIDMKDGALTEVVEDENTAVPPSLVYLLGLKTGID